MSPKIEMVDLVGQYKKIKEEINENVVHVMESGRFINGNEVGEFARNLAEYMGVKHVIPCANGTDALTIALMALDLQPGDEVIVPNFTFVAPVEAVAFLGYKPVFVDVNMDTFDILPSQIEQVITDRTKAIVVVHLYGQSCDMEPVLAVAKKHNLWVIGDNAQSIGAKYTFSDGKEATTGTMGHIGCTSFFPSKNLGCYGDGGALFTESDELAAKIRTIANHGSNKQYHHVVLGVNSRLDTIQAVVLKVKLKYLNDYIHSRQSVAQQYTEAFKGINAIVTPTVRANGTHVFHQYTIRVKNGMRDDLKAHLASNGIASMIYYPIPLHRQEAYAKYWNNQTDVSLNNSIQLASEVLSLPIHTEMTEETIKYITSTVQHFFQN